MITNIYDHFQLIKKSYDLASVYIDKNIIKDFLTDPYFYDLYIVYDEENKFMFSSQYLNEIYKFVESKIIHKKHKYKKDLYIDKINIINIKLSKTKYEHNTFMYIADYFHFYHQHKNITNYTIKQFLNQYYNINTENQIQLLNDHLAELCTAIHKLNHYLVQKPEINEFYWNRFMAVVSDCSYFIFKFLDIIAVLVMIFAMVLFMTIKHYPVMFSLYFINVILKIVMLIKKWRTWPSHHVLHAGALFNRKQYLFSEFIISIVYIIAGVLSSIYTLTKISTILFHIELGIGFETENFIVRIVIISICLVDCTNAIIEWANKKTKRNKIVMNS